MHRYDDKIRDAGVRCGQTSGVCLRPKIGTREVPTLGKSEECMYSVICYSDQSGSMKITLYSVIFYSTQINDAFQLLAAYSLLCC